MNVWQPTKSKLSEEQYASLTDYERGEHFHECKNGRQVQYKTLMRRRDERQSRRAEHDRLSKHFEERRALWLARH